MRGRGARRLRLGAVRCEIGLVCTVALALLAAPAVTALRSECDLCPPDCPMHQHHDGAQNEPAAHLGCHHAVTFNGRSGAPQAPSGKPALGCTTCGNHSLLSDTALPPMLLPSGHALPMRVPAMAARISRDALSSRGFDPPDTPPPISAMCAA